MPSSMSINVKPVQCKGGRAMTLGICGASVAYPTLGNLIKSLGPKMGTLILWEEK